MLNVLTSMSIIGVVVVAMTFVLVAGGLADLSVPATVATGAILSLAFQPVLGTVGAFGAGVMAATAAGVLNGVLVGYGRINAIIVTLATGTIILGAAQWSVGGVIVYGAYPTSGDLLKGRIAGVPGIVLVFGLAALMGHLLLSRTVWGRWTRATGDNYAAATAATVPVRLVRAGAFVLTGLAGGVSGGLLGLTLQNARPGIGQGYEFDAITAVVVGGVSILGGQGSVGRAVGGLVFVQLLTNVMTLAGVRTPVQGLALGLLIIAAVALDVAVRRRGGS
ncbi:Ribose ABC transport system, permease protein RbsC [Rubellimicrobium mesophilum DSM 19309]|uniref:Ribose ABC transport system, permease protein RbsC n=1 Tax=Rubellimicrobium mesophilum DSM 19309 TaxID=442562 RepID=A0A017HSB4_9RHOB|nr:Ribose ABC transport system, permease protein RbsC [Rubellimicrobium mesophilum DSM 19309]